MTTNKATTKKASAKKSSAKDTIRVRQTGSPIGRQGIQRATLIGLGLNKIGRTRELQNSPEVRGMIHKVKHLVVVEGA